MSDVLIKNIPPRVHAWLKREASINRRSMTQQAVVILEAGMNRPQPIRFPAPTPVKGRLLTVAEFDAAKKAGRA